MEAQLGLHTADKPTHRQVEDRAAKLARLIQAAGGKVVTDAWETQAAPDDGGWLTRITATYTIRNPRRRRTT